MCVTIVKITGTVKCGTPFCTNLIIMCIVLFQDLVVSSKFSPRHQLLVTGCLEGRIIWYQPHSGGEI